MKFFEGVSYCFFGGGYGGFFGGGFFETETNLVFDTKVLKDQCV